MYLFYQIGFILVGNLPLEISYKFAETIAYVYYLLAGKDKQGLRSNLKIVLGPDAAAGIVEKYVLDVFRNFAKYLVDFFKMPRLTEKYIREHIKIKGREYLDRCLSEGKGAVIVSLHIGNWELGGAVIGGLGYPVTAIVLEHADKKIRDFFLRQRVINGLVSIPLGAQVKECFNVLKRNEFLAIVGDKDYTSNGIDVDFFGKKAVMPRGPAVFSLRTGAPVVCCVTLREKDDSFSVVFSEPIRYEKIGDTEKDIRGLMGIYIREFERVIKKYPGQWYVFRRLWEQE
ncbi:MAG: lysophospholipid acyltransferase family protein [Candidatus Omnitrophota bacterium]